MTAPVGEQRVARVAQVVRDSSGERLRESRVLDLGCNDGGFSIELARLGVREVIGIEGREANLTSGLATQRNEGLSQVKFVISDVRDFSVKEYGEFDVVLCLGLLYHLDVPDLFEFVRTVAAACRGYAIIETQIGLAPKATVASNGSTYRGLWYAEDVSRPGASLDNPRSFWLTKPSLLNLLADAGFTSVSEVLYPVIPALNAYRDHTLLVAAKGQPIADAQHNRWPERLTNIASPGQSRLYWIRDRIARVRGGGLPSIFR